jgi:hypothetical protein
MMGNRLNVTRRFKLVLFDDKIATAILEPFTENHSCCLLRASAKTAPIKAFPYVRHRASSISSKSTPMCSSVIGTV